MKLGDLNHWTALKIQARMSGIDEMVSYASEEITEACLALRAGTQNIDALEMAKSLSELQFNLEIACEDIDYVQGLIGSGIADAQEDDSEVND